MKLEKVTASNMAMGYTHPDLAAMYARPFTVKGVTYKMIFMNRVNPEYTREVEEKDVGTYYVIMSRLCRER